MAKKILWCFDFGHRGPEPGKSNEEMARAVSMLIRQGGQRFDKILAQDGCGYGTHGFGTALRRFRVVNPDFEVGVSRKGPKAYLNTREVVERFEEFYPPQPRDQVWIACHQAAWRGTRIILRPMGIEPYDMLGYDNFSYDPDSWQFQARGPIRCFLYKFWALGGYILRGEIFRRS